MRRLADKIERIAPLDPAARDALLELACEVRTVRRGTSLASEGKPAATCALLLSGWACRRRYTEGGSSAIVALVAPLDFLDVENLFLARSDHDIVALTAATILTMPMASLQAAVLGHRAIARALWVDALIEASIGREWLVNVGRRDAGQRVAHLLCELATRTSPRCDAGTRQFDLPLSQEQIADVCGLTSVHVNRVLRRLDEDGAIVRERRRIIIPDLARLSQLGDFDAAYLHVAER